MFPRHPLPQGALTKEELHRCMQESPDTIIFYVSAPSNFQDSEIVRKKASIYVGNGPGCYFRNYLFAYAHSLRIRRAKEAENA